MATEISITASPNAIPAMDTLIMGLEKEAPFPERNRRLMKYSKFNGMICFSKINRLRLILSHHFIYCIIMGNTLKNIVLFFVSLIGFSLHSCGSPLRQAEPLAIENAIILKTGAERTIHYFDRLLNSKAIAVVANQTSLLGEVHLVDTLVAAGINVVKVFAPEHGFRGEAEAGAHINSTIDPKTGLPIVSLYGKKKKPDEADLKGIDVVVFDIQDVGARFYTYISTLAYIMEACAEQHITVLILDRPNPNGFYVDGPVLDPAFSSFVGMHRIPIVHGLTMAEYGRMINGERWLKSGVQCQLEWITVEGYTHNTRYALPVRPSPNLPDMESIYLYPSLCLFEGTVVSVGRGTNMPFRIIGHPDFKEGNFAFTPKAIKGVSENPPYKGIACTGLDLSPYADDIRQNGRLRLNWLIDMYNSVGKEGKFFDNFFDKLAGNADLRNQILAGKTEAEIVGSWQPALTEFKTIRKKYLLYEDFE
jgi:uncharacterized protein YbbC (DUF1343 family)